MRTAVPPSLLLVLGALSLVPASARAQTGGALPPPVAQVPVEVAAASAGVTLHQVLVEGPRSHWTGRRYDATRPLCTAPCELTLPAGTYRFALSDGGDPVRASSLVDLRGATRLDLDFENRDGLRTTGWVIFGAGALVGAGLALAGTLTLLDSNDEGLSYGLMIGGLSVIALGGLIAIPFVGFQDHVRITPTSISGTF